ncbi:histidine phosphatase family protein [Pseudomonas sp. O230]|uniref:histidine phosphatase family protein n=1 Tax=Pseudomonas sp. O230 TaxID=3159450 RepID=UPI00387AACA6
MRVRLIRHAESAANAGMATISPHSIPLTELGKQQARILADSIRWPPDLVISSPFERALHTAQPTALRFPDAPVETWAVEEFTYLNPGRFEATTQAERKPIAEAYWHTSDKTAVDGLGAESFAQLLGRAQNMLDRLASLNTAQVFVFSHGQFIRAVAWFIRHGEAAGTPELMREFRRLDTQEPLANCSGYDLALRDGRWFIDYQVSPDGNVRFIDQFCTDQAFGSLPIAPVTGEIRNAMKHFKKLHLESMRAPVRGRLS